MCASVFQHTLVILGRMSLNIITQTMAHEEFCYLILSVSIQKLNIYNFNYTFIKYIRLLYIHFLLTSLFIRCGADVLNRISFSQTDCLYNTYILIDTLYIAVNLYINCN